MLVGDDVAPLINDDAGAHPIHLAGGRLAISRGLIPRGFLAVDIDDRIAHALHGFNQEGTPGFGRRSGRDHESRPDYGQATEGTTALAHWAKMHNRVFAAGESMVMAIIANHSDYTQRMQDLGPRFQSRLPTSKSTRPSKLLETRGYDAHRLPSRNLGSHSEGFEHRKTPAAYAAYES